MILDKDLLSIQEARNLAVKAKETQQEYQHYNQQQVDKIVKVMAEAGYQASEKLAKMACEESGFGIYEDKIIKTQIVCVFFERLLALAGTGNASALPVSPE